MTPDQRATADVYSSIPLATRVQIMNDLSDYASTIADPLVAAGVMRAANRFLRQATAVEREKRQANGRKQA